MIRLGLFLGWSGLILLVMLIPLPGLELIWIGQLDALVHFSLFLILGGLAHRTAGEDNWSGTLILISGLLLVGPESLQSIVPTRGFSWLDLFFNVSGFVYGILLVNLTHPLTYVSLGTIVLGGTYGASLFQDVLFTAVFSPIPQPLILFLPALNGLLAVVLFAVFSRSVSARWFIGLGGIFYLGALRLADDPLVTSVTGILYLCLMVLLSFDYANRLPSGSPGFLRSLAVIFLVTSVLSATVDGPFFLLHAGAVLGIGLMGGVLITLAVESLTPQRLFSTRSSSHS